MDQKQNPATQQFLENEHLSKHFVTTRFPEKWLFIRTDFLSTFGKSHWKRVKTIFVCRAVAAAAAEFANCINSRGHSLRGRRGCRGHAWLITPENLLNFSLTLFTCREGREKRKRNFPLKL
jgi:hypothetical protein